MADVDMADAPLSGAGGKKKAGAAGESGKARDDKKRFEVKKVCTEAISTGRSIRAARKHYNSNVANADFLFKPSGTPSPCGHGILL